MPQGVRVRVSPPVQKEKPTFRSWLFYFGQTMVKHLLLYLVENHCVLYFNFKGTKAKQLKGRNFIPFKPFLCYLNCFGFKFSLAFSIILFCLVSFLLAETIQYNKIFLTDLLRLSKYSVEPL